MTPKPPKKVPTRKKKGRQRRKETKNGVREPISMAQTMHRKTKERGGKLDVLLPMVVTLAVSHFETSELKAEAELNTATSKCPCRGC